MNNEVKARTRIQDLTEIEIPENSEMVYHLIDKHFMPGRIGQYTVFKFNENPTEFLSKNSFQEGRNDDFENYFDSEFESYTSVDDHNVPDKYHVIWDDKYLYLEISAIYFVYYEESKLLIVFVSIR